MNFRHVMIVLKKEIKDLLRDRKTWLTSIIIPFIMIPSLLFIVMNIQTNTEEDARSHIPIAVQGDSTPIVQVLTANPAIQLVKSENPQQALKDGKIRAILKVDDQFSEKLSHNIPVSIVLDYDSSNQKSAIAEGIIQQTVAGMQEQIVKSRLESQHISPDVLTPFMIKSVNVATEEQKTGGFLSFMIPLLLIISSVSGGMAAAIDLMAGEKERGTLEALLTAPVNGMSVLTAKLVTVALMGCVSALATTFSMVAAFSYMPKFLGKGVPEDFTFSLSFLTVGNVSLILLLLFLLSIMFAALLLGLSSLAKTFKEAQTYLSPVLIVAMIPPYLTMAMAPNEIPVNYFFIPVINVTVIFKELLFGIVNAQHILYAVGSTFLFVIVAISLAAMLFRRESLIVKS